MPTRPRPSPSLIYWIARLGADDGFYVFVGVGVEHPPDLFVGLAVDLIIGQQGVDGPAVVRHLYIGHRPQPDKLALAHLSQMLHSLIQPVRRLRIEHRRQLSRHFQPVINMSQHDSQPPQIEFLRVLSLSYDVSEMQRSSK